MKSLLGRLFLISIFGIGIFVAYQTFPDVFAEYFSVEASSHSPQLERLDQRVVADYKLMKERGLMPNLSSGLVKVEFETNSQNPEIAKIADSYQELFRTNRRGKSIMKISLIENESQLLVLMSLENAKTKNRYWELGRTLSLAKK